MGVVFIGYRREDSSAHAGRLFDRLVQAFGAGRVFMDVDGIQPGEDFVERLETVIGACEVMLVMIGKQWLGPRLAEENDYVRLEVKTALERNIRVIPVLVAGAKMPAAEELPVELASLSRRQAVELRDASFSQSVAPLIRSLEQILSSVSKAPGQDARVVERPVNLGFDGAVENGYPHGWFNSAGFVANVSTRYQVSLHSRTDSVGRSLMLQRERAEPGEFGSVMQRFPAEFLAGHTVRLEGELRTERVREWAGLWLRADGREEPDLFFDNMQGQQLQGTTGWKTYSLDGYLPASTTWLNIGLVLSGSGILWADKLRLRVWDASNLWMDV